MQFKKNKKINLLFSIVFLLTLIAFVVLLNWDKGNSQVNDDIFGSTMDVLIEMIFLAPVIIAEFDVFYVVKYFLLMKCNRNKYRDWINISSCVISIIMIMVMLFGFIADYYFNMYVDYYSLTELTCLWILFYLIFRIIYCISVKLKGKS